MLRQLEEPDYKGPRHDLGEGQPLAAAEEGCGVLQERLELLDDGGGEVLGGGGPLGGPLGGELEPVGRGRELRDVGVDEEVDPRAAEGAAGLARGGDEVGGVGVGEELGDDGGLGEDLAIVGERGDEAAGVDGEVGLGAGDGEVDDFLLKGDVELGEGDVGALGPCVRV